VQGGLGGPFFRGVIGHRKPRGVGRARDPGFLEPERSIDAAGSAAVSIVEDSDLIIEPGIRNGAVGSPRPITDDVEVDANDRIKAGEIRLPDSCSFRAIRAG
jgi:hypothetical protein